LNGRGFAHPTAFTEHPQLFSFAIDAEGKATASAINKFIHP
jgi:hypothetical protein